MKTFLLATVIAFTATQARAETFNYACNIITDPSGNTVDQRFETHLVKIDEQKHTFRWRGKTYQITSGTTMPDTCGKYGWHMTGHGTSFDFCAATKGVGFFVGQPKSVADGASENGDVSCSFFVKD